MSDILVSDGPRLSDELLLDEFCFWRSLPSSWQILSISLLSSCVRLKALRRSPLIGLYIWLRWRVLPMLGIEGWCSSAVVLVLPAPITCVCIAGHRLRAMMRRRYYGADITDADQCSPPIIPVGVQFMASEATWLATAARKAERMGAPFVDLNAGCPSPRVFSRCAGSGLLADPEQLAELVRTMVQAVSIPVTVKIRLGISDKSLLQENIMAIRESGAALLTVHGRRRCDTYQSAVDIGGIAQAVSWAGSLPVIANGGVHDAQSARDLLRESNAAGLMIGHGLLRDPTLGRQLAGGAAPTLQEARKFIADYARSLIQAYGLAASFGRFKRLLRYYDCAGILSDPPQRKAVLRASDFPAMGRVLGCDLLAAPER